MRTVDDLSLKELRTLAARIHETVNGLVWSPDTVATISDILADFGLSVAAPSYPLSRAAGRRRSSRTAAIRR